MSSSKSERDENEKYKASIQARIDSNSFCSFRREKQFDHLFPRLRADLTSNPGANILDLCCGYGRLIHFMREEFPETEVFGFDYVESLIGQAKKNFQGDPKIHLEVRNAFDISQHFPKRFDFTVNYKTLAWLPYYETLISEAIKVTRKKIYLTSLFWEGDIDFMVRVVEHPMKTQGEVYTHLNTYSLPKFTDFCLKQGAREVRATDMKLDIDLPPPKDPGQLGTHTIRAEDGPRLECTGPILLNWKLVEITL